MSVDNFINRDLPSKSKSIRSKSGCKQCKVSRKKCNEAKPRCLRCAARDISCEYASGESPAPPSASSQKTYASSVPHGAGVQDPQLGQWGSNAAEQLPQTNVQNVTTPGRPSRDPQHRGWPSAESVDFDLDGFDLEGPMRFIESAFPTVYTSPASTSSSIRPRAASLQEQPLSLTLQDDVFSTETGASDLVTGLRERERSYFFHFQGSFYETIIRKQEDPKSFYAHFARLAGFKPLLHAILAVGAAHQAQSDPQSPSAQTTIDDCLEWHSKAIRGLKVSIESKTKCSRNAIIACTFCLLFYEMVQGGFSTAPTHHLLGALHLMKTDANAGLNKTSTFHHKLFRYYDVMAALSLGKRPLTGSLTYEEDVPSRTRDHNYTNTDPYGCVDSVFGLAKGLWPLLHRLAQLTKNAHPHEATYGSPTNSTRSAEATNLVQSTLEQKRHRNSLVALELSIKGWKPQLELYVANMEHEESDSNLQSLLQNAEAYRHAALVHLYSRLFGDYPDTERIQRATKASLQACLRVMVFGAPFGGLLWPLFIAGASAIAPGDREIARTVMEQLLSVQSMANIASTRALLEEVWAIADGSNDFVPWQDVAKSKGWSVILT